MCRVPANIPRQSWASKLVTEPVAAYSNILSCRVSVRVGKARYEPYLDIPNLQVVVHPNVTTKAIHEIDVMVV